MESQINPTEAPQMEIIFKHFRPKADTGDLVLEEVTVSYASIKSFGVRQRRAYRKNRGFKKFFPEPWIIAEGGSYNKILSASTFKTLKEVFKGKCEVSKEVIEENKQTRYGYSPRKAVEWTYVVKEK
jgi:hypothetical protein